MIPVEVSQLLARAVRSVWALELLLFLREHALNSWSVDQLSVEQRSSRSVVHRAIPALIREGLVREVDGARYQYRAEGDIDQLVASLEHLYKERPVTIVRAIVLASDDQIQSLADAFKFRRD